LNVSINFTKIKSSNKINRDANLPENVVKVAGKELRRLKKMSPQMPEYPMLRHYLELVADLPWDKSSNEHIDLRKAKQVNSFSSINGKKDLRDQIPHR
jgi:ATP-dependent Lon protease